MVPVPVNYAQLDGRIATVALPANLAHLVLTAPPYVTVTTMQHVTMLTVAAPITNAQLAGRMPTVA
ncbi:hypothetical protein DPMN_159906 [Dreissena polymorpha]|uniref:Uncharacterized protein n=1 Tax=Dreissena polymorpha TaxID=45954 RepID=A0A9D4EQ30_DREPO|nr:hypothetical protein DPMN_159906 [Dreissena polymorpha]